MKKPIILISCLLCCSLLVPAGPAQAKKKHKPGGHDLPPGLQKKVERGRELPPGWQKKLKRDEQLDDSIYIQLESPPHEVISVLPPPPPGVSFRKLEDKIVEINDINRRILDVLEIDKLPVPVPRLSKLPLPPLP
jgi:hypothetical protein